MGQLVGGGGATYFHLNVVVHPNPLVINFYLLVQTSQGPWMASLVEQYPTTKPHYRYIHDTLHTDTEVAQLALADGWWWLYITTFYVVALSLLSLSL